MRILHALPKTSCLYANSGNNGEGIDLVFAGTANTENEEVTLTLESGVNFGGWNLVGNPFAETAYIADGRDFYVMNADGSDIEPAERDSIAPMEGVFVIAEADGETMTFTTEVPNNNGKGLVLNLSHGNGVIDRAIIRFGEGSQLPKLQLWKNSTKVYIPQNGKDYAVVNVGKDVARYVSTIPVYFKAGENGTYTLSFNAEEVSFSYLHLIDNLTGEDVDLLAGVSTLRVASGTTSSATYTFEAKTTDPESRFKLVFIASTSVDGND
jgi:hypothetical protein